MLKRRSLSVNMDVYKDNGPTTGHHNFVNFTMEWYKVFISFLSLIISVSCGYAPVAPAVPAAYASGLFTPYAAAPYAPYAAAPYAPYAAAPVAGRLLTSAPVVEQAPLAVAPVARVAAPLAVGPVAKIVKPEYADAHPQYAYSYAVQDSLTGDSKGQEEVREGGVVKGSYRLIEPDGTRRIVNYYADPVNGFNAVVHRDLPVAAVKAAPAVAVV